MIHQAICFFLFSLILHYNVLITIEELLGVSFTIEMIFEFTRGSHGPAGGTNVVVVLGSVEGRGCSGSELSIFYSNLNFNHKRSVENTNRQPIKLN